MAGSLDCRKVEDDEMRGVEKETEVSAVATQRPFGTVAMDITSFCNLRCPFCLSGHDLPKTFMSEEIFDKAISLIPLTDTNNFLFSCLYEPTIHPKFSDFIERIPQEFRQKVFFTTNLAKRITDDVFERLSCSGIHHINISLDSLEPATFEYFRKGAKFSLFHENLTRLVEVFSAASNPPQLFYVSVVNKLNFQEIPSLMEQCATRYLGTFHDVREYWLLTHQNELDWCIDNRLSENELETLKETLAGLPYDYHFSESGRDLGILLPGNNYRGEEIFDEEGRSGNLYFNPYAKPSIRIQADGKVIVLGRNSHFNLQDIEFPVPFFADLYSILENDIEKSDELQKMAGVVIQQTLAVKSFGRVHYSIDKVLYDPKTLKLCGWCFCPDGREAELHLKLADIPKVRLRYTPLASPDVEALHGKAATCCRFEVRVNLNYNYSPEELSGLTLFIGPAGESENVPSLPCRIRNKLKNGLFR